MIKKYLNWCYLFSFLWWFLYDENSIYSLLWAIRLCVNHTRMWTLIASCVTRLQSTALSPERDIDTRTAWSEDECGQLSRVTMTLLNRVTSKIFPKAVMKNISQDCWNAYESYIQQNVRLYYDYNRIGVLSLPCNHNNNRNWSTNPNLKVCAM